MRPSRTAAKAAAKLFEEVYARQPNHPGVLHYLIHAYDDPEHAQLGLKAARAYAKAAAAVPHALHMPSHIFTRLGYWEESAATNLRGWNVSEDDVKRAHESGAYRDFHNLNLRICLYSARALPRCAAYCGHHQGAVRGVA